MRAISYVARITLLAIIAIVSTPAAVAAQSEAVEYYGLDALGSVRVIFDAQGGVVDRMDYGPFGENLRAAIKFPVEQFAQTARDSESGQDYAQARNHDVSLGRFNRVDPAYRGLFDPQKWNRYVYARNNPVLFVDPAGLDECPTTYCETVVAEDPGETFAERWKAFVAWVEANGNLDLGGAFKSPDLTGGGSADAGGGGDEIIANLCAQYPQSCTNSDPEITIAGVPNGTTGVIAYFGRINGRIVYVGITNDIPRRAAEHLDRFVISPIVNGLTRLEARALEQAIMLQYPDLLNKINSISQRNGIYDKAVPWGQSLLRKLGLW